MTSENWQKIEEILDVILESRIEEWPAILDRTCGHDEPLRNEIETLLRHYHGAQNFLHSSAGDILHSLSEADISIREDITTEYKTIDKYTIKKEIARGGMGRVFLAERTDGVYTQNVALKVLHSDLDSKAMQRRFRIERQILASLNHPNIARLLDGGVVESESGRGSHQPYLVMEYVEGISIKEYCKEKNLTIQDRLKLFIKAANAVQHAHRNLIVHCDIKPSNILVNNEGEVKLLDFGISRLLSGETIPGTQYTTQTIRRWMTPEYAAPEQIKSERTTTAIDVYQLGVLLYELLTGVLPFSREGRSIRELEEAILKNDPDKPSSLVQSERDRRMIKGDLDTIILKALRKEPDSRYESTTAFIEDVRRYLSGRPVHARRGGFSYTAGKFIQRHRRGVAVTVIILLLSGTLVGFYTHRLAFERDRAEIAAGQAQVEAQTAEQVAEFLMGLFEASRPERARGNEVTARDLLVQGVERAELLHDQPEVQARMFSVIGKTYHRFGMYDEAQKHYERSLVLREQLFDSENEQIAESLNDLGVLSRYRGDYEAAEQYLRQAVAMRRNLIEGDHNDLAISIEELGRLLRDRGEYEEAESLFREGLEMRRRIFGNEHHETVASLGSVALLLRDLGDFEGAEPLFREAVSTYRKILEENHPWLAAAKSNLALVLINLKNWEEAESLLHRALELERSALDPEHVNLAIRLNHLGTVYRNQGRYLEADTVQREAIRITRNALGDSHPWLTGFLLNHGRIYFDQGDYATAESIIRESLQIHLIAFPEDDWRVAEAKGWLGVVLAKLDQYSEAEPLILDSYVTMQNIWGLHDRRTQAARERVVSFYESWGQPEQAARYYTIPELDDAEE